MRAHTIHHVTAVTSSLQNNLDFYTKTLGLRLVKKSVNQDDVKAYHLYYADKVGSPGTDLTFFDWPRIGSNMPGPGTISLIKFRVPEASLDWWQERLEEAGAQPERGQDSSRDAIGFSDTEGQRLALVGADDVPGESVAWDKEVPKENAILGFLGVDLDSQRPRETVRVLTELLGFKQAHVSDAVFEAGDDKSHAVVRLVGSEARRPGRVGAGGVHHIAFRIADDDELFAMKEKIEAAGIGTSGFVDRFYFHSLYFREPGGILLELATDGPGFAVDEAPESLGERLSLPPFLEPRREEIEAGLVGK